MEAVIIGPNRKLKIWIRFIYKSASRVKVAATFVSFNIQYNVKLNKVIIKMPYFNYE